MYGCRARCQGCGIFFLTAKSNQRRQDLRCVFGCRAHYESEQSKLRSGEYYQTDEGRRKKQELNQNRKKPDASKLPQTKEPKQDPILRYYQWLLLVVDGIQLNLEGLTHFLIKIREQLRQLPLPNFKKAVKVPDE